VAETVARALPSCVLHRMADGSAVIVTPHGDAFALNPDAAELWPDPSRTLSEVRTAFERRGLTPSEAASAAADFLRQLEDAQLIWLEAA